MVQSFHTVALGAVGVTFITTADTQAWCDGTGTVVSFTNLQVAQTRNPELAAGRKLPLCPDANSLYTHY